MKVDINQISSSHSLSKKCYPLPNLEASCVCVCVTMPP